MSKFLQDSNGNIIELNNGLLAIDIVTPSGLDCNTAHNITGESITESFSFLLQSVKNSSATQASSSTTLQGSITCEVGDRIIVACVVRSALTVPSGWTLISTSRVATGDVGDYNQTLSWLTKVATSTTETIDIVQASSARIYITMMSFPSGTTYTDNGYAYADTRMSSLEASGYNGLCLWACSSNYESSWAISEQSLYYGTSSSSRLGCFESNQDNEDNVIINAGSETYMIVGCLTITINE